MQKIPFHGSPELLRCLVNESTQQAPAHAQPFKSSACLKTNDFVCLEYKYAAKIQIIATQFWTV